MIKRSMTIIGVVLVYVFGISYALKYLPLQETPEWLAALFNRKIHASLFWWKMRHLLVVMLLSYCLAQLLIRQDRNNARTNSISVGLLSVLWGIGFAWVVVGTIHLGWTEITDYLVIGFGIPLWTALFCWHNKCGNSASNPPLEPSR